MVSLECDEVVPSHEAPVQNPSPETLSACGESLDLVSVLERLDLMCRKEVRAAPRPDRSGMPRGPPPADPAPSRGYWDRAPTPPAPKRSCPVSESNFHGRGRAARPWVGGERALKIMCLCLDTIQNTVRAWAEPEATIK